MQVRVLTELAPGTLIDSSKPFRLEWTGARPGHIVNVRLLSFIPLGFATGLEYFVPAEEGSVTLETREPLPGRPSLPLTPGDDFRVIVRVLAPAASFTAPGLTFEGRHAAIEEYHFLGLKLHTAVQQQRP